MLPVLTADCYGSMNIASKFVHMVAGEVTGR
jgi:hypothetical protein